MVLDLFSDRLSPCVGLLRGSKFLAAFRSIEQGEIGSGLARFEFLDPCLRRQYYLRLN